MRRKIGKYKIYNSGKKNRSLIETGVIWLTTHQKGMIMSLTIPIEYNSRNYTNKKRFSLGNLLKKLQKEFGNTILRQGAYYSQYYINIRFLCEDIDKMNKIFEKTYTIYPRGYDEVKDTFIKYRFSVKLHTSIKDAYNMALLDRL